MTHQMDDSEELSVYRVNEIEKRIGRIEIKVDQIQEILTTIQITLATHHNPGEADFCRRHTELLGDYNSRISAIENSMGELKAQLAKWGGVAACILFFISLLGDTVMKLIFH